MSRDYVLISPCRNESQYMRRTLDSVVGQTVLPARWVIVDDGSTDETPDILKAYADAHPWIHVVTREDRGKRSVGPGVVDAFYAGLRSIDLDDYAYLCKLDLDLELPLNYFEDLILRMEAEPRIGTCSGKPYFPPQRPDEATLESTDLISEACGDEASVGMTKFYRTRCFRQIGGFVRGLNWDSIDCHRCRMLGWIAISWDEPALRFLHLRAMGSSQQSWWTGKVRQGASQHFMGTGPLYFLVSAAYRMTRPPVIWGGLAQIWGYASCVVTRSSRYGEADFRKFLRGFHRASLRYGKAAALAQYHEEGAAVWDPESGPTADQQSSRATEEVAS